MKSKDKTGEEKKSGIPLQLCEMCIWKSQQSENKILCFFPKCVYQVNVYKADGAKRACTEYIDKCTGKRVVIFESAEKQNK